MTDEERLQQFEARIAAGDKIEPGDWMPELYKKQLIRLIHQHANSEIMGALPEGTWIPYAPNFKRKLALMAKVQDEVGHGQLLYRAAETLGKSREQMTEELLSGKSKYSNVFNYPCETWADIGIIGWLVDGAAVINQTLMSEGSYGPYSRALKRICLEESFHIKQGYDIVITLMSGTGAQRAMVQDALNRWWWPIIMFFGPHDKDSVHTETLMRWGVKPKSNDEQRQEFLSKFLPKIWELGLTVPDPDIYIDETGFVHFTDPDWNEFYAVINGGGPMGPERLAVRRLSYQETVWVRRAVEGKRVGPVPQMA